MGTSGDGVLMGGATIASGHVVLSSSGDHVTLPAGMLTGVMNILTVEMWASFGVPNVTSSWAKVFYFGHSTNNKPAVQCYRDASKGKLACSIDQELTGTGLSTNLTFDGAVNAHVVTIFNVQRGYMKIYVSGVLHAMGAVQVAMPGIGSGNVYLLGKNPHTDPTMIGRFNEFRVWSRELSAFQVAKHALIGPAELLGKQLP